MNIFTKLVFRRIAGQLSSTVRNYHVRSGITKLHGDVKPVLCNDLKISSLVQRTVIPLNYGVPKPSIIDKPRFDIVEKIDTSLPDKVDITPTKEIEDPTSVNIIEKKAHRMLRIKRKKIKKHKRRKLRKRMQYAWAKIRRKREAKKETDFRNEIIGKLKDAKRFNAEAYVASKLELYRREIVPARIPGGVRMPEFVVLEVREKKRQKFLKRLEQQERRRAMLKERGTLAVSLDDRLK